MVKYANLHLHSNFSDAGFTPRELVVIGKSLGYKALALTDHETDGGCKQFAQACREEGIEFVHGVEFYGREGGVVPHLVALDFDPDCPSIRSFIRKCIDVYTEGTRKCFENGVKLGIIDGITWDDVLSFCYEDTWVCADTVVETFRLKKLPVPEDMETRLFKGAAAKPFRGEKPSAKEVIEAVRKADGIVALAHANERTFPVLNELIGYGLNGIEVDHPRLSDQILPLVLQAAETHKLYHCGGSDHSGPMSSFGGDCAFPAFNGITEEELYVLKNRKLG